MATQSTYTWANLNLSHRSVLTGTDLSPEWALVRVRQALEEHRGETSGHPSTGQLDFDEAVPWIQLSGTVLPRYVAGHVKAEAVPTGVAVTATANLSTLLVAFVASLFGVTILFRLAHLLFTGLYWTFLGLVPLAAAWHLWMISRVLRMVTTAGVTL